MKREFSGRIAVVTGGTGGLGRDLVIALAREECEVFFCGRREDVRETLSRCDGRGHYFRCDLTRPEEVADFVREAAAFRGRIDYLVNNAADDARVRFEEADCEAFDRFVALDLRAAYLATRAALDGLRAGEGRAVVNIGTTNWMLGLAPFTLYSSAKAGLLGFTRALARELGPEGIRVNMLSPGWIMTEKQLRCYVTEQDKQNLLRDQALPFLLRESDVTPVTMFLLSDAARAVTGQNLIVDAGKVMQ